MALRNNDGLDVKTFLTYSVLPAIVILIGIALWMIKSNNNELVSNSAIPVLQDTSAASAPQTAQGATEQAGVSNNFAIPSTAVGLAVGDYTGKTPEIINILDKMGGYKMDASKNANDTVYVIYDPRCPYCHELYARIKATDMDTKNLTVKWLPSVALGVDSIDDPAIPRAAYALTAASDADFEKTLSDAFSENVELSEENMMRVEENFAFLLEASKQTFGESYQVSVPAAFFVDKNTGEPQMMYGASGDDVFRAIFGE